MIYKILCEQCAAQIGSIEKDVISNDDIALYRQMVTCGTCNTQTTNICLSDGTPVEIDGE